MDDLLTTRQLQDLLQLDRVTIYRMLGDGRLRGFKVGGQWRFSRREIEAWLQQQQSRLEPVATPSPPNGSIIPSHQALPLSCVEAIQDVCAEALDIAVVTIDMDGTPLTEVSNSYHFCDLILSTDEGRRRCTSDWRSVVNGQVHVCHAGLLCASALIEVSGRSVAITAGCQFASEAWETDLSTLALDLGLNEQELRAAAGMVRVVPESHTARVSRLLQRITSTFSEIGEERLSLLSRLKHIAEMSQVQ